MKNVNKSSSQEITGTVERVIFHAPDTGYTVASVAPEDNGSPVVVVGKIASLQEGERGKFTGKWVENPRYGRQFQVKSYQELRHSTIEGIEKYLSSGMIKGIGPQLARRLVKKFGIDTLDVIDENPGRLREVEGIGKHRLEKIKSAWIQQKNVRDAMVFLRAHGIGPRRSVRIYKKYGNRVREIISKNPYRLAEEVWGIGFKRADKIARNLGFEKQSPQRARAGVIHVLNRASDNGHCFLPIKELLKKCRDLEIPTDLVQESLEELISQKRLVKSGEKIYLSHLYYCEERIAEKLASMIKYKSSTLFNDAGEDLEAVFDMFDLKLSPGQKKAVRTALGSNVSIITGGPGVGKTTILKILVDILVKRGEKIALCAPTGRAARRMSESVGMEAKTIHRLLRYKPGENDFQHNQANPLLYDWVIIDETSMVDTPLFYNLTRALLDRTRLLMVGDVDQLPSVGPGMVLKDLINSGVIPTIRLVEIFRQEEGSLIIRNAHRINRGKLPVISQNTKKLSNFYFIPCDEPGKINDLILKTVSSRIPERFKMDPVEDVQVLSPMKKSKLGVQSLNNDLQNLLNPGKPVMGSLKIGDKVLQVRNNYDKEVYNGDIGIVVAADPETRKVVVDFDGNLVQYENFELDEIILAYACTVHKSQGSEFPAVVMPLYTGHYILLQRNLLYTAVTRAKKLVVLIGSRKALAIAVKNNRVQQRHTGLKEKLREKAAD